MGCVRSLEHYPSFSKRASLTEFSDHVMNPFQGPIAGNLSSLSMHFKMQTLGIQENQGFCNQIPVTSPIECEPISPSSLPLTARTQSTFAMFPRFSAGSKVTGVTPGRAGRELSSNGIVPVWNSSPEKEKARLCTESAARPLYSGSMYSKYNKSQSTAATSSSRKLCNEMAITVPDADSSSFSGSHSLEESMGLSIESKADMEADSEGRVPTSSVLKRMNQQGLSAHFSGKSRSFTSLADAAGLGSIEEFAKPESPYAKRRKGKLLDRYKSFPLRIVDKSISKKPSGNRCSSAAMAIAISGINKEQSRMMESLSETSDEENNAQQIPTLTPFSTSTRMWYQNGLVPSHRSQSMVDFSHVLATSP